MSRQCEIVQDLLPLYVDDICSEASRNMVSEHISGCAECAAVLRRLKNTEIEEELGTEKTEVIAKHNKVFRRKSALVGLIIGAALTIPVLIVFIVTLAGGSSIRSLFIVFMAILLAASLVVVPLVVPRNKLLWTLGAGTICLLALLAVAIIGSGNRGFLIAASAILFGLTVIFAPIVVNHRAVKPYLGKNKALIVMGAYTVMFVLMMVCIGISVNDPDFWRMGIGLPVFFLALAWIMFLIIRYLKVNGFIKAGLCCIIVGALLFALNNILVLLTGYTVPWPQFNPLVWNAFTIDGNVKWLALCAGGLIGIIFIIIGLIKGGKKK